MRISLVIPSFYPAVVYGGPIFTSLHTAEELAKVGIEVWVSTTNANKENKLDVTLNKWNKLKEKLYVKYYNTTVKHTISLPMFFMMWSDIRQADIVHIQSIYNVSTPFALWYSMLFKKPVLLSPHGQLGDWCMLHGSRLKEKWLKWLIYPFRDIIIWHATAENEKYNIHANVEDAEVIVIPNGVDFNSFKISSALSSQVFTKKFTGKELDAGKVIVSLGRLQKVKGFDVLIDAFAKVLEQYPAAKLFIAGQDEGEEENLREQIKRLRLENKAFLTGAISGQEKIDFLANADLFVLPSHNENFGIVYAESLAAGTPIVASINTPWSEVEDADCGKWVNNSVDETAQAMLEMLKKDRETMRVNARNLAKKYDWKNIALQFKEVFDEMLRRKDV